MKRSRLVLVGAAAIDVSLAYAESGQADNGKLIFELKSCNTCHLSQRSPGRPPYVPPEPEH